MMATATASVLAVAAGLNAWIVLLITGGLAHYGRGLRLSPGFEELAGGGMLAVFALLLGLESILGKLPALERRITGWNWVLRPAAGAALFAAIPNPVAELSLLLGLIVGGLLALATHALGEVARAALVPSMRGLAGMFVGMVATAAAAVLTPLALRVPLPAALLTGGGLILLTWELVLAPRLRKRRLAQPPHRSPGSPPAGRPEEEGVSASPRLRVSASPEPRPPVRVLPGPPTDRGRSPRP